MELQCDLCGEPITQDSEGQLTDDTVLCTACLEMARSKEAERQVVGPTFTEEDMKQGKWL